MDGNPGACVPDDRIDPDICATAECGAGVLPYHVATCEENCVAAALIACKAAAKGNWAKEHACRASVKQFCKKTACDCGK